MVTGESGAASGSVTGAVPNVRKGPGGVEGSERRRAPRVFPTRPGARAKRAEGRAKEAAGSLTGNEDRKAEGRADQDKGTLKKKKGAAKDLLS